MLSSFLLVTVPWMQISLAVQDKITVSTLALLSVVAVGLALHVVYLAINTGLVTLFGLGGDDTEDATAIRRAVILLSSQKTLLMSVTVLASLSNLLGGAMGFAVVPCVLSHLGQIVVDSVLVARWMRQDERKSQ